MHIYNLYSDDFTSITLTTEQKVITHHIANPQEIAGYLGSCKIQCADLLMHTSFLANVPLLQHYLLHKEEILSLSKTYPNAKIASKEATLTINTMAIVNAYCIKLQEA